MARLLLAPLLLSLACLTAPPAGDKAVGIFDVRVKASPVVVELNEPLILTVEILGNGPTRRAPRRIRLQDLPSFDKQFHIEDLPDPAVTVEPNRWAFRYRLRPKSLDVRRVPSIAFEYVHPNGEEQTAYSSPVALEVKPRSEQAVVIGGNFPDQLPPAVREVATGPDVLRRFPDPCPPAAWLWVVLALVPPAGCYLWYRTWRRLYPDASRQTRVRRSQSAAKALKSLHKLSRDQDGTDRFAEIVAVLTGYLADQLHFSARSLTPREVALHLIQAEVPAETVAAVDEFLRACDAQRYAPAAECEWRHLAEDAEQLILTLESETCFAARRQPTDPLSSFGRSP